GAARCRARSAQHSLHDLAEIGWWHGDEIALTPLVAERTNAPPTEAIGACLVTCHRENRGEDLGRRRVGVRDVRTDGRQAGGDGARRGHSGERRSDGDGCSPQVAGAFAGATLRGEDAAVAPPKEPYTRALHPTEMLLDKRLGLLGIHRGQVVDRLRAAE